MPTPSFWFNPTDPDFAKQIDALPPTPGYCIVVDIAGSTAMKQRGIRHWIAMINNCFANATGFLQPFAPLKSIGDALMFYIEEADLEESGYIPLQIFDALWQIVTDPNPVIPPIKIGAARCEHAYSLTFFQGNQDYYGSDIDLTARLEACAEERQVVIERRFYNAVAADYERFGNRQQFASFRSLRGPEHAPLKGIPGEVDIFRAGRQ